MLKVVLRFPTESVGIILRYDVYNKGPLPLVFAFLSAPRLGRVTTLFLPLSVDGRSDKAFTSFQNTYLIIILGTTENIIPTLYAI
nr:hypothetical protein Q903MT_gene2951 [Picea sitchensis]